MFQSSEAGHTGRTGCGDMVFDSMKYAQGSVLISSV